MRKIYYCILTLILLMLNQSITFAAATQKEMKAYSNGIILMNEGKYKEAQSIFKQLIRDNKNFVDASWSLSELYARMGNDAERIKTLKYVAQPKMVRYYNSLMRLANAYFETCNYEEAIASYQLVPVKEAGYYKVAQKNIKICQEALEMMKKPVPFNATNMGTNINTIYDDYWPSETADESMFITTVKLNRLEGQSDFAKNVHEDIFISTKENGKWGKIKNAGPNINTIQNEGAQSISLDGRYMFFVACDRQTGFGSCDIYYSMRQGNGWSPAQNCGVPINTKNWESDPSLSPTGDELYFVSNRPGGIGKSDVWVASVTINNDGSLSFGKPRNCGPNINSTEDELSPFIHADNKTLFFSSRGRGGLGKYDVFVSYKENGNWTAPHNIGYPLNTCKDEIGFTVNANGDKAYFASNGQIKNGNGRDIYEIKLEEGNYKPVKRMKYARGKIVDATTGEPIEAQIDVYSIKNNEKVFKSVSDPKTGEFITCSPEGEDVGVDVDKKGYLFYSDYADENSRIKFNSDGVKMDKIEVGKKMVLKNIYFDFDKSTLRPASHNELDHLVKFMKDNPTVKICLQGHTDIVGNKAYNQELSERRAKAAYDYLTKHGIVAARMQYKGFGSDKPIGDNNTAAGRQLNRRTEVEITAK